MNTIHDKDFSDLLRIEGVNSKGYGINPKLPMLDRRLTRDARCIYAYIRSFAGAGTTAFPSTSKMAFDLCFGSTDTLRKHLKLLVKYGYIKIHQERATKGDVDFKGESIKPGTFKRNIYTLIENPVEVEEKIEENKPIDEPIENTETQPNPKNLGTDKIEENKGETPYPNYRGTDDRGTDKLGTNNNSIKNNSINNVVVEETTNEELSLPLMKKINDLNFKFKYTFSLNDIDSILDAYSNNLDLINTSLEYMINNEPKKGFKNFVGFLINAKGYKDTTKEIKNEFQAPASNGAYIKPQDKPNKKKTGFHLANSRGDKYTASELEEIILAKSREKIKNIKKE